MITVRISKVWTWPPMMLIKRRFTLLWQHSNACRCFTRRWYWKPYIFSLQVTSNATTANGQQRCLKDLIDLTWCSDKSADLHCFGNIPRLVGSLKNSLCACLIHLYTPSFLLPFGSPELPSLSPSELRRWCFPLNPNPPNKMKIPIWGGICFWQIPRLVLVAFKDIVDESKDLDLEFNFILDSTDHLSICLFHLENSQTLI